ncbi:hypothetical protein ACVWWT_002453 [Pseudomonas sp. TE6349]
MLPTARIRQARACCARMPPALHDTAWEMFGFGYSFFHQWPRFRLWAQQSDPCQLCRDRGRILQIVPTLAGKARGGHVNQAQGAIAGRAAHVCQGTRPSCSRCRRTAPGGGIGHVRHLCQSCRRCATCAPGRVLRQVRLGRAPGRAGRPLPAATGQGAPASRLNKGCSPGATTGQGRCCRTTASGLRRRRGASYQILRVGVEWSTLFNDTRPLADPLGRSSMSLPI